MASSTTKVLILAIAVSMMGCNFSKDKSSKEVGNGQSLEAAAKVRKELRDLVFSDNELVANRLKAVSKSDLNFVDYDSDNLLAYIIRLGARIKLPIYVENGLSIFLPNKYSDVTNLSLKKKLMDKYKGAAISADDLGQSDGSVMLQFLQNKYEDTFAKMYEAFQAKNSESARYLANQAVIPCSALISGMLMSQQLQGQNDSDRLFAFFQDMGCKMQDVSRADLQFLWKIEIDKQFAQKFSDLRVLKEIRSVNDTSYYTAVASLDLSVGLRMLMKLSKYCDVYVADGKNQVRCNAISDSDTSVESAVTEVLHFNQTSIMEYIGAQIIYLPPKPLGDDGENDLQFTKFDSKVNNDCTDEIRIAEVQNQADVILTFRGLPRIPEICKNNAVVTDGQENARE